MILDFTKLFPNACREQGIDEFYANVDDVRYFKRVLLKGTGFCAEQRVEDILQIGNSTLKFPAIDDGIIILKSIVDAKNIIKEFAENREFIDKQYLTIIEKESEMSKAYLSECIIKYGTGIQPK